jgi:hypothetical protein
MNSIMLAQNAVLIGGLILGGIIIVIVLFTSIFLCV